MALSYQCKIIYFDSYGAYKKPLLSSTVGSLLPSCNFCCDPPFSVEWLNNWFFSSSPRWGEFAKTDQRKKPRCIWVTLLRVIVLLFQLCYEWEASQAHKLVSSLSQFMQTLTLLGPHLLDGGNDPRNGLNTRYQKSLLGTRIQVNLAILLHISVLFLFFFPC